MAFINKHDTNGTKGLLAKGELGYDDYAAGGDTGRVYVGTGTENIALAERLESSMMTKAEFNALAEERKANRAGSGFEEWGKHFADSSVVINEGMWTAATYQNKFVLGISTSGVGISKTTYPVINANGVLQKILYTNTSSINNAEILLPTAPTIYPHDTVLTAEQIASGVIKHADASNSGLIVNGKFDVDTRGWATSRTTLSINDSGQIVVAGTDALVNHAARSSNFNTVVGKKYILEVEIISISGGATGFFAAGLTFDINSNLGYYYPQKVGKYILTLTATSTESSIHLHSGTAALATAIFDNVAVYPADAISRSDLVFLESWHEDISEKNIVYPLGNVQYLGGNTDGLTGIANGAFTGFETYSLFGNWQAQSLIGKGYVWSSLTESQKKAFIANPENNCYLDGDKTIQVRYRVRVVQGLGDSWYDIDRLAYGISGSAFSALKYSEGANTYIPARGKKVSIVKEIGGAPDFLTFGYSADNRSLGTWSTDSTNTSVAYEGKCFAIPLALVHRRNQGMYHNVYNPNGTKLASDDLDCFTTTVSFNSISDCFDPAKLLTASGYIGTVSGRPDGLFYVQVHEGDVQDLRNSSKKVEDYNRLISREFNKLVAGATRGFEGEKYTEITTQTTTGTVATVQVKDGTRYKRGDVIYIYDLTASSVKGRFVVVSISSNTLTVDTAFAKLANSYMISGASSTRTKSNTLLVCDVIGNPSNYPAVWKNNGVTFTTLHTAEDGTSLLPDGTRDTFKLSRDANATPLLCLRSTDNGATWASFTPAFSTTTNAITLTDEPANNLVVVYYRTKTLMGVSVINSEVLEVGDGFVTNTSNAQMGCYLTSTLLGKIPIGATSFSSGNLSNKRFEILGVLLDLTSIPYSKIFQGSSISIPSHNNLLLTDTVTPTVKVFPYLTRANGKAYLNLVFKEMKHNGTSWGDDAKFNIVDNVSTTTDNNAQTVLIGQKTVELPYFIGADE